MRALAHDPGDRFQSAEEMAAALGPAVPPPAMTHPPPDEELPAPAGGSFFRTWMAGPLLLLAVAGVATGGFLVFQQVQPGDPSATAGGQTVEIVAATDHDPLGDDRENPGTVPSAIDGNADTAWSSEGYEDADFGGLKDGVGLVLDLGSDRDIAGIDLQTPLPGWRFELFGGDQPEVIEAVLASQDGTTSFVADAETALELEQSRHRYILVWVTELAAAPDGPYRAQIGEVDVLSSSG